MKALPTVLFSAAIGVMPFAASAQVFQDTFDTSLSSGVETNINFQIGEGRQSGGAVSSNYLEANVGNGNAFLNVPASGFASDVLLLRTNYISGQANAGVALLNANFASSLAGTAYNISFTGQISSSAGASTDLWLSVFLGGDSTASGPNGATTDYGVLLRPNGNATEWRDNSSVTQTGVTGITAGGVFTFDLLVDETGVDPTAQFTINRGTAEEFNSEPFAFDFEVDDAGNRFFGLRGQQGGSAGTNGSAALADFRYDNLTITAVPEPSTVALLAGGAMTLLAVARRRRSQG